MEVTQLRDEARGAGSYNQERGKDLEYRVIATNKAGEGVPSNTVGPREDASDWMRGNYCMEARLSLRFAIRDDDTCFFTRPEQLEANYAKVWDVCPVGLSVVPFHASTKTGALPAEHWTGEEVFPIGDNIDLVKYLREMIVRKRVYITLHGYSHRDEAEGYEFEVGQDLERKVREGKRYLEQVFETPIRIFVPPHNALSQRGFKAVVGNGLSICSHVGLRSGERNVTAVGQFFRRRWWTWRRGHGPPFATRYSTHTVLPYQSLTPLVSLADLKVALSHCRRWDGDFCLATHYWEFGEQQRTGEDETMGKVFQEFWEAVTQIPDVGFVSMEEML